MRARITAVCVAVAVAGSGLATAAAGTTGSGNVATATSTPSAAPLWSGSHVRLSIDSTSPSASVTLGGVTIAARRVVEQGAGTRVTETASGWSFQRPGSLVVEVALAVGDRLVVAVSKERAGQVTAAVGSGERVLLRVVDDRHDLLGTGQGNRVSGALTRQDLAPTVPELPQRDSRKLALAFAYPWWNTYGDRHLSEQPADARPWGTAAGVLSMTRQARSAGLDGFILSYAGESNGAALDRALVAARLTGGVVAPYLETAEAVRQARFLASKRELAETWIRSALRRSGDSAFLKLAGVPVVFVYSMADLPARDWATITRDLQSSGQRVLLVGDAGAPEYRQLLTGYHDYSATASTQAISSRSQYDSTVLRVPTAVYPQQLPGLYAATVSPGYDDHKLRGRTNPVVPRDDGRRYTATWQSALSGRPDWLLVTSWNEWFEGTQIEPGRQSGDVALQQTASLVRAWRADG